MPRHRFTSDSARAAQQRRYKGALKSVLIPKGTPLVMAEGFTVPGHFSRKYTKVVMAEDCYVLIREHLLIR